MRPKQLQQVALLLGGLVTGESVAHAKAIAVEAHGQAVVVGGENERARKSALTMATHKAVEQVAAKHGGPAEGDDPIVDRELYARSAEFVTQWGRITEEVDDNIFEVDAAITIDEDRVRAALKGRRGQAQTQSKGGDRAGRVLVLATEQLGPHKIFGWTDVVWGWGYGSAKTTMLRQVTEMGGMEATMSDVLGQSGMRVIDPDVLKGKVKQRSAFEALNISTDAGRSLASTANADFVVIAKGVALDAYHSTIAQAGMYSGQANVVARLVRVRDGKVLASSTQHAAQVHIDLDTARLNALNEAARMAAEDLVKENRK